jgi:hypothetical protein
MVERAHSFHAEKFRCYYAGNPAASQALQILNDLPWKTK